MDPQIKPWSEGMESVNRMQRGQTLNQTELMQLAELKRNQAAQALADQYMQQHPEAFFGGGQQLPMLSTLGQPAAGAGPLTQTTTRPGQPPGAPQVIPGGQDLSQFATQGTPQSTLGALGPQPQAPQNPLIEMAKRNPQAAFLLQKQLLGQEDLQVKRQEQQLSMGTKVLDHVGRLAQGVTDQASLDAMRSDLISQGLGKYAAQLPQTYSTEAMAPFIAKALDVKEAMTLQVQDLQAQAALMKARREQANIPNYTGDAIVDGLIYTKMKNQPAGTMPSPEIVDEAIKERERTLQLRSERQGIAAAEIERTEKPLEGEAAKAVSDLTALRDMTNDIARLRKDAYTGVGKDWGGNIQERLGESVPGVGKLGAEEIDFRRTVRDIQDLMARLRSGAALPASEQQRLEKLVPSISDPPEVFKAKLESFQRSLETMRDARLRTGTTGRGQLRDETRAGTQAQPTSQGSSGGAQAGNTFTDADIAATLANPANKGKTRQQVIDAALAKGLVYKER